MRIVDVYRCTGFLLYLYHVFGELRQRIITQT